MADSAVDTITILLTLAALTSAALQDVRSREISDIHWLVLGIGGALLALIKSILTEGFSAGYILMFLGCAVAVVDITAYRGLNWRAVYLPMASLFVCGLALMYFSSDPLLIQWASAPILYLLFILCYSAGLLKGGADVKCLVCLAFTFPMIPCFAGFPALPVPDGPMPLVFNHTVGIFFTGTALVAAYAVAYSIRYGAEGRLMEISEARNAFVWPKYDVVDGKLERVPAMEDPSEVYDRLETFGKTEVRVTPMIPFLLPILVAFAIVTFVGNPFFLFI